MGSRGQFEPPAYPEGGVDAALYLVNTLLEPRLADVIRREIDGTTNCSWIAGNAPMVVSLAVAKAAANGSGTDDRAPSVFRGAWDGVALDLVRGHGITGG
jgi:hypothetical protein